jgi:hypothetical protein
MRQVTCKKRRSESTMIIAKIEAFPLRIPINPGIKSDAAV